MKFYTCDEAGCDRTMVAIISPWFLLRVGHDQGSSEDLTFCSLAHLQSWLTRYSQTGQLYGVS